MSLGFAAEGVSGNQEKSVMPVFVNADGIGDLCTSREAMEIGRPGGTAPTASLATAGSTCPIAPPNGHSAASP